MAVLSDPLAHYPPNPGGRYVIIGCGFSAVLNHLTLKKTPEGKRRIGDRQVLHIGHDDPWEHFVPHDMGQFPHLLRLPGFSQCFPEARVDAPLRSDVFAAATQAEFANLASSRRAEPAPLGPRMHGWVALIQEKAAPPPTDAAVLALTAELGLTASDLERYPYDVPYRLLVVSHAGDGQARCSFVYADRIDLCVGPGAPRLLDRQRFAADEAGDSMWRAYTRLPWEPVESLGAPRFVLPGVHAMYSSTASPHLRDPAYCVYGSGGIALNLVEVRTGRGWIDWMADRVHSQDICDRNNSVFIIPENGGCLRAADRRTRLGEWVDIECLHLSDTTFKVRNRGDDRDPPDGNLCNPGICQVRDYWDRTHALDRVRCCFPHAPHPDLHPPLPERYDQVLVSIGLEAHDQRPGTVGWLARAFDSWYARRGGDERLMSWEYFGRRPSDGTESEIRILGSAAHVLQPHAAPGYDDARVRENAAAYFETLPRQCRPGPKPAPPRKPGELPLVMSITFNATAVAFANGYFGFQRANRNVNTMSEAELIHFLAENEVLAEEIVELRRESQFGFRSRQELERALGLQWWSRTRRRLGRLEFDYAGSDHW